MTTTRSRRLASALVAALALVATACGQGTEDPAAAPTAEETLPPADDGAGAAGGTTMRVYSVSEAMTESAEGSLHVVGLLIDDGSGWRLCEVALESYPPQCGDPSLAVEGLEPEGLPLEEEGEVRWQSGATVVGEIVGDTLTVTGSPSSS